MMMNVQIVFFSCLWFTVINAYQYNYDRSRGSQYDGGYPVSGVELAETIERDLQKTLDSLKHMGENTYDNDWRQNSPFRKLSDEIDRNLKDALNSRNNWGDRISNIVNEDVAPLSKLGDQISKTVKDALKNVHWATSNWVGYNYNFRIPSVPKRNELKYDRYPGIYINDGSPPFSYKNLELKQKLLAGVGGNTVLNISSSGKFLVARYGVLYKCDRQFNRTGHCVDGALSYFQPVNGDDFCFVTPNSQINNRICLGANDGVTLSLYNGDFSCDSTDGSPTLLITTQEYEKMCKKLVAGITYTYTPDLNDPFYVPLPLADPTVKCKNTGSVSCVFTY